MPAEANGIERAIFMVQKLVVILDSVHNIIKRMNMPPYDVVFTNAGCCMAVCALMDLGYKCTFTSVEKNKHCRMLASHLYPEIEHYHTNDVTVLHDDILTRKFDVRVNSANCQPLSGLNSRSLVWADPRMDSYTAACKAEAGPPARSAGPGRGPSPLGVFSLENRAGPS